MSPAAAECNKLNHSLCTMVSRCSGSCQGSLKRLIQGRLSGGATAAAAQVQKGARCWLQVIAPYDSEDARGLLKASIRDPDPVVFLENEILYGESFPVSEQMLDKDFVLPIGQAKVTRSCPRFSVSRNCCVQRRLCL